MSHTHRGLVVVATLFVGAVLISGCTFSLSQAPAVTPTLIPTGLFVSPFPSVENPMEMIEEFARQTAAAQTAIASGQTPGPASTPVAVITGTVLTPQTGATPTPTNTAPSTPTNTSGTAVVVLPSFTPGGPTSTPGVRPTSHTLMKGEFPYCIARRFDVNPNELLTLNGLSNGQIYYPNLTLKIPQTGNPFPPPRALRTHPTTYTATAGDETVYGVACRFGDVDPVAIASANGISVSSAVTAGQQLKIP